MLRIIKGSITELCDITKVFDSEYWLNDSSQKILLPYIKSTQELMNSTIQQYDKNGVANIIPSFDLGFSYNTGRIAGGFTTGMVVHWDSEVPFVPIDMTIKECSGSVVSISIDNIDFFNTERINNCLQKMNNQGYRFNFKTGNHFISLYRDKNKRYYLVIHSGDDSYRDINTGIYPSNEIWYKDQIKTSFDKTRSRYLNYLVDEYAERFVRIAINKRKDIAQFHRHLSEEIILGYGSIENQYTFQHYGFCFPNTAVLGTGFIKANEVFPIFSNEGLPIVIVKPTEKMWSVKVNNERRFVIPHGWGQDIRGITNLSNQWQNGKIILTINDEIIAQDISYTSKLPRDIAQIRVLKDYESFINGDISFEKCWNNKLYVDVVDILYPCASYSDNDKKTVLWEA